MTIAELGALGEFIGSVLVLGTLVYLVIQVRQARNSFVSANAVNLTQIFNPLNMALAQDGELFDLFFRGCNEAGSLTEAEAARLHMLFRAFNNNFWCIHQCAENGTFPREDWEMLSRNFAELLATPSGRTLIQSLEYTNPPWSRVMQALADSVEGEMRWTPEGFKLRASEG